MNKERLMKLLYGPCITEKSTMIAEKHQQITFKVASNASKTEVRQAVEWLFEVEVEKVQTRRVRGKGKVFRNIKGKRSAWKKAYVKLKPGFDINFMEH